MQKQGSDLMFESSVAYVDVVETSDNTLLMGEEVLQVITDTQQLMSVKEDDVTHRLESSNLVNNVMKVLEQYDV